MSAGALPVRQGSMPVRQESVRGQSAGAVGGEGTLEMRHGHNEKEPSPDGVRWR